MAVIEPTTDRSQEPRGYESSVRRISYEESTCEIAGSHPVANIGKTYDDLRSEAVWNVCILLLGFSLLSGCAINGAGRIEKINGQIPPNKAIIIVGVAGEDVRGPGVTAAQFDQFSIEQSRITGDCGRFNRLEAVVDAAEKVTYLAFNAPPGYYVVSPFLVANVDPSALVAIQAQAGTASYLGDFYFRGVGGDASEVTIFRRQNIQKAGEFARAIGLKTTPVLGAPQAIKERGGVFLCTP